MVGTGVGATNGVLVKGGAALEVASKVNTIVFDKTGTITKGSPVVTDFRQLGEKSESEDQQTNEDYLLWLLGSLERSSEHPLAKAVVQFAEEKLGDALKSNPFIEPANFRAVTGRGTCGTLLGRVSVAVGNRSFATAMDYQIPLVADQEMRDLEKDGKTAILAIVDGAVVAVIGIADELKDDAPDAIRFLQDKLHFDVWMMTGDNATTADAIRKQLDLRPDRVVAEALPSTKLDRIVSLQENGAIVAMVGDGINDSPALAQANVGISLATGAEIAAEAADIILVSGKHMKEVCTAMHLTSTIFSRIKWNLGWSLFYNCMAIPIAAGVLFPLTHERLPPTFAAAAMAFSSISVVLSSLMLYRYKPPTISAEESSPDVVGSNSTLTTPLLRNDHLNSQGEILGDDDAAERGEAAVSS